MSARKHGAWGWWIGAASLVLAASCGRPGANEAGSVVLYSSVDDALLREVAGQFERDTGVRVLVVTDTEATKTTGLVQRLIDERGRPKADVWWSSEALGTVRLNREGALEAAAPASVMEFPGGWPADLTGADGLWHGFAWRARAIAFSTKRVPRGEAPVAISDLLAEKWKGRVGMARPQFGTTRSHMAAFAADKGEDALRGWLAGMRANGLRLYDGNASVVRAIASGEIDVGLTDSDDVWAAKRNGWEIEGVFEVELGALLIPNTAALVRGGPNPGAALRLLDFLLSERVERLIAGSDSRNIPIRPGLALEFEGNAVPKGWRVDWDLVADAAPGAMKVCDEALAGP